MSPNFGGFGNSSSELGSIYVIFGLHLSCFDGLGIFFKQKKEKSIEPGSITNLLKGLFFFNLGNTVLSLPLA